MSFLKVNSPMQDNKKEIYITYVLVTKMSTALVETFLLPKEVGVLAR